MLTKEELAARLTGREYMLEITDELEAEAKAAGLLVVYGYSDDSVELRGAWHDEISMYDGGDFDIDRDGIVHEVDDESLLDHGAEWVAEMVERRKRARTISALWCESEWPWMYRTDIPHATFEIYDEGEKYCRGIVIALADLGSP